jgi:hypothetical protein
MNTSPSLQRKVDSLCFCFASFMSNKYGNFESFGNVQNIDYLWHPHPIAIVYQFEIDLRC